MNPVQVRQRRPRQCSQCHMERCNKSSPACPVNIRITVRMTKEFRRNPVARNSIITTFGIDPNNEPNWWIRIRKAQNSHERQLQIAARLEIAARLAKINITISKTDTPCDPEECGICLETNCTVTTNCNHNYCVGCIKSMLLKTNRFDCAYCRCNITTLKTADNSFIKIISKLKRVKVSMQ